MGHRNIYPKEVLTMRDKAGTNQTQFWAKVGVTQSGGSRYETGHCSIPEPVAILLDLVYGIKGPQLLAKMRGK